MKLGFQNLLFSINTNAQCNTASFVIMLIVLDLLEITVSNYSTDFFLSAARRRTSSLHETLAYEHEGLHFDMELTIHKLC